MTECKYRHLIFGEAIQNFPIAGVTCAKCPMPPYIGLDSIPVTYRGHMEDGGQRYDVFAIDPSHRGYCACGEPREFIFDTCGGDGGIADELFKDILVKVDAETGIERG